MHLADSPFLLAQIDQMHFSFALCYILFIFPVLFHEPEPVEIEIASRQENKTYIAGSTDRLQRKFLFRLLFRMGEFHNLCDFFLRRSESDLDHVLFHRRTAADHDTGGPLFSHIHIGIFQRYVVADLRYPAFLPAETVPVKMVALHCQQLFIRLLQPGKGKSFQMDLGMKDKTDTGNPFQPFFSR